MPRTKGAVNKPKFISVKLSDLNKVFKDDALIQISIDYAMLFEDSAEPSDKAEINKKITLKSVNDGISITKI